MFAQDTVIGTFSGLLSIIGKVALAVMLAFGAGYLVGVASTDDCAKPYTNE